MIAAICLFIVHKIIVQFSVFSEKIFSTMAAVELDPNFIKALRLLRSKSKDSGAQLRAMLDDAIRQKKGLGPAPRSPSVSKQHSKSQNMR